MFIKKITYEDFDGNQRTEEHYFNLTKTKLLDMEMSAEGGLEKYINKIINEQDSNKIMDLFKDIIKRSYGIKSPDGKRFIQNEEVFTEFEQSLAYDELFFELATDADAAAKFINGIIPKELAKQIDAENKVIGIATK